MLYVEIDKQAGGNLQQSHIRYELIRIDRLQRIQRLDFDNQLMFNNQIGYVCLRVLKILVDQVNLDPALVWDVAKLEFMVKAGLIT